MNFSLMDLKLVRECAWWVWLYLGNHTWRLSMNTRCAKMGEVLDGHVAFQWL